jgi:hypothetical protein
VIFSTDGSVPLITIRQDGTLVYGPDYTPDTAARTFWEALSGLPRNVADIKEKVERLEQDFARLDSKYGNDWTEWRDVRESIQELKAATK